MHVVRPVAPQIEELSMATTKLKVVSVSLTMMKSAVL